MHNFTSLVCFRSGMGRGLVSFIVLLLSVGVCTASVSVCVICAFLATPIVSPTSSVSSFDRRSMPGMRAGQR